MPRVSEYPFSNTAINVAAQDLRRALMRAAENVTARTGQIMSAYLPHVSQVGKFPRDYFFEISSSPLDVCFGGCGCRTHPPPPDGGWFLLNEREKKLFPAWTEEDIAERILEGHSCPPPGG